MSCGVVVPGKGTWAALGFKWDRGSRLSVSLLLFIVMPGVFAEAQHAWSVETVDSTPGSDVGWYAALAIDAAGSLHVAYYDAAHQGLLYSFRGKGDKRWSTTAVDYKGA